jgi:lia operon protein LiaG
MENSVLKHVVRVVIAIVVVAGATVAVIALLGGVTPRETGAVAGAGGRIEVDQVQNLPLDGVQRIDISVVSSDVTVTDSTDGKVNAHLHGSVSSTRSAAEPELVAESRGSTVSLRVDHKSVNVLTGWYRSDLQLEVAIPKSYRGELVIHGVSADVALPAGRTFTALEVTTVSGDVELGASTVKSFACHTISGSLEAPALSSASVELASTSGKMTVGGLTGSLTARTVSGDLAFTWAAFSGSVDVGTTSGSVTLGIPAGSGFRLDAGSTSGRITSDHPVTVRGSTSGPGKHSLTGDVGSGAGSVRVRTVSGGIRIET